MPTKFKLHASLLSALLLLLSSSLFAQTTITGRVLSNSDKQPVVGATVQAKKSKSATVTGADGTFTLTSASKIEGITITNIGYTTMDVPVSGSSLGDILLVLSSTSLNDVIVTGYTAQKKKDITGAVAVVVMKDLKSVPGGNTEALLQGQASGVTVISSGAPGGFSNVRVRGVTTLGSTDPLVIIDGTPGDLHDLNVNDIDQMQVLKDASSAAIYGVRGSNGVIIVTTKKGRNGKATITYDGYYGTQRPLDNGFNIANTQNTANSYVQMQINANPSVPPTTKQFGTTNPSVLPDYITPTYAFNGDPKTDPSTYALYTNQITKANKTGTDWFHEIFKPAPIQSHTISASGGNEKNIYFFSFGYFDQQGTLMNTYLKRFSVRANTLFNVKSNIRVGENLYVFYKQNPGFTNQSEGNAISMSYRESPIIPVYDIMGNYAGTGSQGLGNAQNPVANLARTKDNKSNDWQGTGNAFAEVDFLKHLTVRTQIGGTIDNYYYNSFSYTAYENAENNTNTNNFTENFGYNSSWTWTNTLRYSNVFADKHNLSLLFGTEAIENYQRAISGNRSNYLITDPNNLTTSPDLWTLAFGSPSGQQTTNINNTPYQSSLWSIFGRLDYSFEDKYILGATLRRDASSLFAGDVQSGLFPSVSAGWRISKEDFMGNVTFINDLKIRGGWGKLGSLSNTPINNYLDLYSQAAGNSYYDIGGASNSSALGIYAVSLGNPTTTWEQDKITNIGFDATFLNNHFDMSFDWYQKAVSGLLFRLSLPATAGGAQPPFVNLGDIQNTGVDLSLTYHGNIAKDFKFDLTGTFTSYSNIVKSLPFAYVDELSTNNTGSTRLNAISRLQVGQPVGEFFGYNVLGLFASQADADKAPAQAGKGPGTFQFQDVNNDNKIDAADRTWIGNPNPDFTYGLFISLSYKNFDFSTMLYGSVGNKDFNYIKYWTDFPQVFAGAMSNDVALNSWTPNNLGAKIPMLTTSANFSTSGNVNSFYVEDGSFLKCKQMQIGYTLPGSFLSKYKIDRFRIYVQAANLFQITKYTGLDPELQSSDRYNNSNFGIDFGNYPANQKMYLVGVNLSF